MLGTNIWNCMDINLLVVHTWSLFILHAFMITPVVLMICSCYLSDASQSTQRKCCSILVGMLQVFLKSYRDALAIGISNLKNPTPIKQTNKEKTRLWCRAGKEWLDFTGITVLMKFFLLCLVFSLLWYWKIFSFQETLWLVPLLILTLLS